MKDRHWLLNWLKKTSMWNLLWVSLLLSEVFTLLMNALLGYLWWGSVSLDLLLIGTIDAFVVALLVTVILLYIIDRFREAEREMEVTRGKVEALQQREDVSRWLHDDIGSDLFNVMLIAEMLQEKKTVDRELTDSLNWIGDASRNALNSIRSYLNFAELSGPALGDLVGYMRDYGQALFRKLGISFAFRDDTGSGTVLLPPMKSFSVYLIYKETLTNIIKHAHAAQVEVHVYSEGDAFILTISDDGRGFDPGAPDSPGHGLRSMRYRAETIGADLSITPELREGTLTRLRVSAAGPAR